MSFPRYPKYKPSGVEWLGEVPAHWEVSRFKSVLRERDQRSAVGDETLLSVSAYTGVMPRSELVEDGEHLTRAETLEGYKVCSKNDLIVNIMLAWNRGLGVSPYDGIVSPSYSVFKIVDGTDPWFLNYLVRSDEYIGYFKAFSTGVVDSRLRIYPDTLGQLSCALPTVEEQRVIAAFLDRETAKIDALIAEQEKLIALLAEKRQAVISHAVTKGLNPNAPMKPSGVEWLGEVPAHWEVTKLRFLCDVQTGTRDTEHAVEDGIYPFFVRSQTVERIDSRSFNCEAVLTAGDGAGVGKVFHYYSGPFDFHQRVYMLNNFRGISGRFCFHYLKANFYKVALEGGAKSTVDSLRRPMFLNFYFCAPSVAEQDLIVSWIERESVRIDRLATEVESAIILLRERRAALISAAVTGQIDVRYLAPEPVA